VSVVFNSILRRDNGVFVRFRLHLLQQAVVASVAKHAKHELQYLQTSIDKRK
jgi:hypothetical protein